MGGQPVSEPYRDGDEIGTVEHRIGDGVATGRQAQHHCLPRQIAQPHHIRFGQPPQIELVGCGLADMRELLREVIALALRVLIDEAEKFQCRQMAVDLGFGLAELMRQRREPHRLARSR